MRHWIVLAAACLLYVVPLSAQDVQVDAALSVPETRVGESVVLEITVRTGGERPESIELPALPSGLEVGGSSDFNSVEVAYPGGTRRTLRRNVILVPTRPGRYTIGATTIRVDRQLYRTPELALRVGGGAAGGGGAASGDGASLEARLLPDTAYVGQQVTFQAEARIAADASRRLRRAPEYEPPAPAGFWIEDLPDADAVGTRSVGSRIEEVRSFHRALFPLAPGHYRIPPARLLYETRRGFISAPVARELATDSIPLVVLPLPTAGRPADFNGAVGRYTAHATLEPSVVAAGEGALLTLTIEGTGNLKTVPPPPLPTVPGLRADAPTERTRTEALDGVVRGSKTFTWTLVPDRAGTLELPPVVFAYFDPELGAYRADTADVPALEVRPGAVAVEPEVPASEIAPIVAEPGARPRLGWTRSPAFLLAQLLPLLGLAGILLLRRARTSERTARREHAADRARRLAELQRTLDDDAAAWLDALAVLVRDTVAEQAGDVALRAASPAELEARLRSAGVEPERAGAVAALLRELDTARYAPAPADRAARAALLERAGALISGSAERARSRRPHAAPLLLVLGAGLFGLPPGVAAAEQGAPEAEFRAGVTEYASGRYTQAAERFDAYLSARPDDPNGWYNLGNSAFRSGRTGDAVWAWGRALALEPRHAAARRNLAVAGAPPALLRQVAPWPRLRPEELLLLASIAWIVAAAAAGVYLLRRRREMAWAAGGAAALLAVVLAGWGVLRMGDAGAVVLDPGAGILAAPTLRADTVARAEPGALVGVGERRGGWVRVVDRTGAEGWAEARRIGVLEPAP